MVRVGESTVKNLSWESPAARRIPASGRKVSPKFSPTRLTAVVLLVAGLQRFKGAQLMVPLQVSNLKKLDAAGTYFVVDELPASASHHEFVQATAAMNRRLEEFDLDDAEKVEDNSDNGEAIEEGNVVAEPQQPAEAPEAPAPEDEAGE